MTEKSYNISAEQAKKVISPEWIDFLDRLTLKRFRQEAIAIEASEYIIQQISKNDWEKLSRCREANKLPSFIAVTTKNLAEEFSRKKFGRPRPPAWLKRQGELWIDIWKQLCLERQPQEAVIMKYSDAKQKQPAFIKKIIRTIRLKMPWCGQGDPEVPQSYLQTTQDESGQNELPDLPSFTSPDVILEQNEFQEALHILNLILEVENDETHLEATSGNSHIPENTLKKFNLIQKQLVFEDLEIIILRMLYQSALPKSAVAKSMQLTRHQVSKVEAKALAKIKLQIKKAGLDLENLKERSKTGSTHSNTRIEQG